MNIWKLAQLVSIIVFLAAKVQGMVDAGMNSFQAKEFVTNTLAPSADSAGILDEIEVY